MHCAVPHPEGGGSEPVHHQQRPHPPLTGMRRRTPHRRRTTPPTRGRPLPQAEGKDTIPISSANTLRIDSLVATKRSFQFHFILLR